MTMKENTPPPPPRKPPVPPKPAAKACRPRKRLTVSQWADAHRILTGKSAQEAGSWRTERTPYAREPMDRLSVHVPDHKVVVMAADHGHLARMYDKRMTQENGLTRSASHEHK